MPRRALIALALTLAAVTPMAAQQAGPRAARGRAIVAGVVVDAATGRGVPHALVRAVQGDGERRCYATSTGWFFFAGLPGGNIEIRAERPGYLPGAVGRFRANGKGLHITLHGTELHPAVRIEMFRPAVISGYVADEAGEPISGITVRALRRDLVDGVPQYETPATDVTDDEGSFRLYDLVPGEYTVVVPAVQVSVPLDAIDAIGRTGSVPTEFQLVVNANGVAELSDLLAGVMPRNPDHLIVTSRSPAPPPTSADGIVGYRTQYYPGAERADGATWLEIASGEVRQGVFFQLVPRPASQVSGTVTGPNGPVPGAMVRLAHADDLAPQVALPAAMTLTDAHGRFVLPRVPVGTHTITAVGRLPELSLVPQLVPREPAGERIWGEAAVTVDAAPLEDVAIVVGSAPVVSGTLAFAASTSNSTVPNRGSVSLAIVDVRSGRRVGADISNAGRFVVDTLEPGEYRVEVAAPAGWRRRRVTVDNVETPDARLVLTAGARLDIVVTLTDRIGGVHGAVRDRAGAPVPGAAIVVQPAPSHPSDVLDPSRARIVRAGLDGLYTLDDFAPGDYVLAAIRETAADGWHRADRLTAMRAAGVRVVIADASRGLVDLRLMDR